MCDPVLETLRLFIFPCVGDFDDIFTFLCVGVYTVVCRDFENISEKVPTGIFPCAGEIDYSGKKPYREFFPVLERLIFSGSKSL